MLTKGEWSKKRPYFGHNQVRTPKGLTPGRFYILRITTKKARRIIIQVVESPHLNEDGNWSVKIRLFSGKVAFAECDLPLSEVSMGPLKNGEWNRRNCIMRFPNYKSIF